MNQQSVALLLTVAWCMIALAGMGYIGKAVAERTWILHYAKDLQASEYVTVPMQNTLLLYQVRLILVANNFLFGILSLFNQLHITTVPPMMLSWYVLTSLLVNELTLVWLTVRDQSILMRFMPKRKHWWQWWRKES